MRNSLRNALNPWSAVCGLAIAFCLAGCPSETATLGRPCDTSEDCGAGEMCSADGTCVLQGADADGGNGGGGDVGGEGEVDAGVPAYDAGIPDRPPATPSGPDNAQTDSDCDGLTDEEEFSIIYGYGEDGKPLKTDPNNRDTDGDGLMDGIELGRTESPDPACGCVNGSAEPYCGCTQEEYESRTKAECARYFYGAATPVNATSPVLADTDGDGLMDGEEDRNRNGRLDLGETDPNNPDTDGDGLSDYDELHVHHTDPTTRDTDGDGISDKIELEVACLDPLRPDSDGDGCLDGAEDSNRNGVVDEGETNPCDPSDCGLATGRDSDCDGLSDIEEEKLGTDPLNPDTDGDGLTDGDEMGVTVNPDPANCPNFVPSTHPANPTNPLRKDSDCDGLTDQEELSTYRTDPNNWDSDGDGLSDGLEVGRTTAQNPDPLNCPDFVGDADPATTTDPNNADTDGDGIQDGAEDSNQNGRADQGELNPNDPADGRSSAVQAACATQNLKKISIYDAMEGDIRIAATAEFSEVTKIANNGVPVGVMLYNPTAKVVGLVLSKAPAGATAVAEEANARSLISALGSVTVSLTPSADSASWDGYAFTSNSFSQSSYSDLKAHANAIVQRYYGGATGLLSGTAGVTGPFWIESSFVRRSGNRAIVVMAITQKSHYDANKTTLFELSDTAGGSALAQFGDTTAAQCEIFQSDDMPLVDFVWVVDNSGSMSDEQTAVKNAANYMLSLLNSSSIDWRMAGIGTDYYKYPNKALTGYDEGGYFRPFTKDENTITRWFDYRDKTDGFTTNGSATENAIQSAMFLTERFRNKCDPRPTSSVTVTSCSSQTPDNTLRLRDGAQLVFIFMGDENDCWVKDSSGSCRPRDQSNYNTALAVFKNYDGQGRAAMAYGLEDPSNGQNIIDIISDLGGRSGDIRLATSDAAIRPVFDAIISDVTGALNVYSFSKPPIASTIKLAFDNGTPLMNGGANCTRADVQRSSQHGYEYDATYRTILFYGDCRPTTAGFDIAVSYRYWNDRTGDPNGIDITDLCGECEPPFECDVELGECVCPANCGGSAPPTDPWFCDTKACAQVCPSDCGGCGLNRQCNTSTCQCECEVNATCAANHTFDPEACACVCDVATLSANVPERYEVNADFCGYSCQADCGGCAPGMTCNTSLCVCSGGFN